MSPRLGNIKRRRLALLVTLTVGALVAAVLPASGEAPPTPGDSSGFSFQGEGENRVGSLDSRTGRVQPTAAQRSAAAGIGATTARWNDFGTPHVLFNQRGYLSPARPGAAVDVARDFVAKNRGLFRLSTESVASLEVVRDTPLLDSPDLTRARDGASVRNPDVGHVVMFQQTFGDVLAAWDGLLTVGVQRDGRVAWVSSSVTGDETVSGTRSLDASAAIQAAAADTGLDVGSLSPVEAPGPWTTFNSSVVRDVQRARLMALPTPTDGVRLVWETTLLKADHDDREEQAEPAAFISFVDAETGDVLLRDNRVDHLASGMPREAASADPDALPRWRVFPSNPNFTDAADPSADTRELWCWVNDAESCDEEQINDASRVPWDVQAPSIPTFTTDGNNATTAISEVSFLSPDTIIQRPFSPDRSYDYEWKNTWFNSSCDPSKFDQPGGNDDDASTANLFVMHNRMHDWSYYLGFTERNSNLQQTNFGNTGFGREHDPEVGNAQAGRRTFNGRDNANQITLQDGIPPITNQYLWQPLAGAFYAACTDGAYDMAVVAHEYGHAISNRMVGGPDTGTGNTQGQTESWSDLIFSEYFRGYGITAGEGANPFALAPYVSGNKQRGIRNYGMNNSPLNYSDLGYDGNGTTSPHADGEIWSATNFDIAQALNAKYDAEFPSSDDALQLRCAKGELPADECPGNRRWAQIMFDGLLLTPSGSTMLDSRDAMLAADRLRFDGANQADLWNSFAKRGMGQTASSPNAEDREPTPGWSSPLRADEAKVRFRAVDQNGRIVPDATVFTGSYEARISPTADTDPDTKVPGTVSFVPGTYPFVARADGYGAVRFSRTFNPGKQLVVDVPMRRNLASVHNGATATGDGMNLEALIDDTEGTNWASLESDGTASAGKGEGRQVEGRQVTVELSGEPVEVSTVQVSAALRPTDAENEDSGSQSRFSALRSFDILVCDATLNGNTCEDDEAEFDVAYRSRSNAFPGVRPRPTASDLTLRRFDITPSQATHIRIRVRDNQCTGGPQYQGEQNPMNDPVFSNPDCDSTESTPDRAVLNPPEDLVRIAELQVFGPQ